MICDWTLTWFAFVGLSYQYTVCHTLFKIKILGLKEVIPQNSVRKYRTIGCRIPENRALSVQISLISEVDREVTSAYKRIIEVHSNVKHLPRLLLLFII